MAGNWQVGTGKKLKGRDQQETNRQELAGNWKVGTGWKLAGRYWQATGKQALSGNWHVGTGRKLADMDWQKTGRYELAENWQVGTGRKLVCHAASWREQCWYSVSQVDTVFSKETGESVLDLIRLNSYCLKHTAGPTTTVDGKQHLSLKTSLPGCLASRHYQESGRQRNWQETGSKALAGNWQVGTGRKLAGRGLAENWKIGNGRKRAGRNWQTTGRQGLAENWKVGYGRKLIGSDWQETDRQELAGNWKIGTAGRKLADMDWQKTGRYGLAENQQIWTSRKLVCHAASWRQQCWHSVSQVETVFSK